MKVLYSYKSGTNPVYISGSDYSPLRVLLVFRDLGNLYVYYCSDYLRKTYLNQVSKTSILSQELHVDMLERIESDEAFNNYLSFIKDNYNYDGVHQEEKITGHDQGGAVLVDLEGNTLIKGEGD